MKKNLFIIIVVGVLAVLIGGLVALHFQDVAVITQTRTQLAKVQDTINTLRNDMASMRELTPGSTDVAGVIAAVSSAVVRIDITGAGIVGVGSGFIVDESGYVLTNHHVIADATSIKVTLTTGSSYAATVVDADANRDLALLKLVSPRMDFPKIGLGTASDTTVGEEVMAVGYPLGLELTGPVSFTRGIVSAIRNIGGLDYIQTDAALNPGNSGGPLVDQQGMLVGMCTASVTDPTVNVQGLGLAIPVADVLLFIDSGRISCTNCHYQK